MVKVEAHPRCFGLVGELNMVGMVGLDFGCKSQVGFSLSDE